MTYNPQIHHRRSIRLQNYDYSHPGVYFVTICTQDRKRVFGEIKDGEMHLNDAGQIAQTVWNSLPEHFPDVEIDHYVIMPDHLHGIIKLPGTYFTISEDSNTSKIPERFKQHMYKKGMINQVSTHHASLPTRDVINCPPILGEIIRRFKAITTHQIRGLGKVDFAWQTRFYDHIIRNDDDLNRTRQYIINNPIRWTEASLDTGEDFL